MIDAGAFVKTLGGKPVAVFGLGISNLAAIQALVAAGAAVAAWDDDMAKVATAQSHGARAVNPATADMEPFACLVLAPGVPLHFPAPHPVAANAQRAGLEIVCDIEILHRCRLGRKIVAVTGTNGKSTTTALIGHVLNACGVPAAVGGNIGHAALGLDRPPENGVFVLEVSSYQLDLCPTFAPDIAVLLNITPDHLDRHGSMDAYIKAKARLLRGTGFGVVAVDDGETRRIYEEISAAGYRRLVPVSTQIDLSPGIAARDGRMEGFDLAALSALRGVHNHQNAAAAFAVCRELGLADAAIFAAMQAYPGLPHRQFLEAMIGNVRWVNDCMATSAAATARALACFDDIYWIAGGRPKAGGLGGLEQYGERIRHAFLIGEAADGFAAWMRDNDLPYTISETLEQAAQDAYKMTAGKTGTVLLSAAAASLDQFANFVQRGETFAALVRQLEEKS